MRVRGAGARDTDVIDRLYKEYEFTLDIAHIESLIVVEDDDGDVIAVGSLVTILEGAFLVDTSRPRRERVEAMKLVMRQADIEAAILKYDSYHSFATNLSIVQILKRKFSFKLCRGTALLRWVNNGKSRPEEGR